MKKRIYENPMCRLVKLLKGNFTYDEQNIYITIPYDKFINYIEIWEKLTWEQKEKSANINLK